MRAFSVGVQRRWCQMTPTEKVAAMSRLLLILMLLLASALAEAGDALRHSRSVVALGEEAIGPDGGEPMVDIGDALVVTGYRDEAVVSERDAPRSSTYSWEVGISSVRVDLGADHDGDGFYQNFRLHLDIDTDGGIEWVYLRLYVSFEGGPWNFVHRSSDIRLSWRYPNSELSLSTWLDSGYPTGYYDLRVDLFDADSGRWLLSLGPYDDSVLSALPLEDDRRDTAGYYDGDYYYDGDALAYDATVHGVGGFDAALLLPLALLRRRARRQSFQRSRC